MIRSPALRGRQHVVGHLMANGYDVTVFDSLDHFLKPQFNFLSAATKAFIHPALGAVNMTFSLHHRYHQDQEQAFIFHMTTTIEVL